MKENWSEFVPFLAVLTMLQLGSMGIAKTIGAMPYKKLDRFAKCIEGAVSLASASIIGIVVWSVMVEKPKRSWRNGCLI